MAVDLVEIYKITNFLSLQTSPFVNKCVFRHPFSMKTTRAIKRKMSLEI